MYNFKNFIDDLFNIDIINNTKIKHDSVEQTIEINNLCESKILDNITIVYDNNTNKS